jgi:hypothetical protein
MQQAQVIQNHKNALFIILDKKKLDTDYIISLNLAAIRHMIVQVTKLPL